MATIDSTVDPRIRQYATDQDAEVQALRSRLNSPMSLASFTVATLPSAAKYPRATAWCSNSSNGAVPVYSDGTNWRFFSNNAVVS